MTIRSSVPRVTIFRDYVQGLSTRLNIPWFIARALVGDPAEGAPPDTKLRAIELIDKQFA
jgi:hypothetical protein